MIAKAIQRNVRISSRKATLVCALIRNKSVSDALKILETVEKKTAYFLKKLVVAAAANAVNNHAMNGKTLYIFSAVANQGTTLKRNMPRAKGSSDLIRKRSSHLEIIVSDDVNEKANLNKVLLKPRAHQHKYKPKVIKQVSREVETKIIDKKGVKK